MEKKAYCEGKSNEKMIAVEKNPDKPYGLLENTRKWYTLAR